MTNKYVGLFLSWLEKAKPKRLVKFSGRWVDSDLPFPRSANTFFANINKSEIQLLFGISNFVTEDVKALSIFSISPQKLVELRDFLNTVIESYSERFGSASSPDSAPPSTPSTLVH